MKVRAYNVLISEHRNRLAAFVMEYLNCGWELHGGIAMGDDVDRGAVYAQAVIWRISDKEPVFPE